MIKVTIRDCGRELIVEYIHQHLPTSSTFVEKAVEQFNKIQWDGAAKERG